MAEKKIGVPPSPSRLRRTSRHPRLKAGFHVLIQYIKVFKRHTVHGAKRRKKWLCQLKPESDPYSLYRASTDRQFMAPGGLVFALASYAAARQSSLRRASPRQATQAGKRQVTSARFDTNQSASPCFLSLSGYGEK